MKLLLSLLASFILFCNGINAIAETNLPYEQEGMIYNIHPETGQFNVGDLMYTILPGTVINKTNGEKFTGLDLLQPNTAIGYTMQGDIITEVWILDREPIDHSVNDG